jgi:hypothetical protein
VEPKEPQPQPEPTETKTPGAGTRGTLTGDVDRLSPDERKIADRLTNNGNDVVAVPTGPNKTPDFLVNGKATELKTVKGIKDTSEDGLSDGISSRILNARSQAPNIIIDAENQPGMTREAAVRAIARARDADKKLGERIESIEILTPEGPVKYTRQ